MRRRAVLAAAAVALATALLTGCATRYDQAGLSRVGIFLWGFGDPPGVNWNLPARRDVRDPPAAPLRDLPPSHDMPHSSARFDAFVSFDGARDMQGASIDDNRDRVPCRTPVSTDPVARRADDCDDAARGR
jgi:hypothetical protein